MTSRAPLILASGSAIRAQLLARAGLSFSILRPNVDETELKTKFKTVSAGRNSRRTSPRPRPSPFPAATRKHWSSAPIRS